MRPFWSFLMILDDLREDWPMRSADTPELAGFLTGDDQGEHLVGEQRRVLGHGLAELLAGGDAGDEVADDTFEERASHAVGLQREAFGDADVAVEATRQTAEELGAVFDAGLFEADAMHRLVQADDVLDGGGFVAGHAGADQGFFLGVGVHHGDGGASGADVGDGDFLSMAGRGRRAWGRGQGAGRLLFMAPSSLRLAPGFHGS